MTITQRIMFWLCVLVLQVGPASTGTGVLAQAITQAQLTTLVPDERDLQGFIRVRPAGESPAQEVFQNGKWIKKEAPASPSEDKIQVERDASERFNGWAPLTTMKGRVSHLQRDLYSLDGLYHIEIHVSLCPSPAAAMEELSLLRGASSGNFEIGSFTGAEMVGDESWFLLGTNFKHLLFRAGNLIVHISGSPSYAASRNKIQAVFPPVAVDAVAYQILLRASRQTGLTGVSANSTRLAVNGKPLDGTSLAVGKQTYVPVREFAKAMGLQSQWNEKTGALTLNGPMQQTITVTAASTEARVGQTLVVLKIPVLKEANQPVMALDDLLRLVKGKVTSRKGDTIEVKA